MDSSTTRSRNQKEKVARLTQLTSEETIELNSFLVSFVFHTILLLTLALMYSSQEISKPIILNICFSNMSEDVVDTTTTIANIDPVPPETQNHSDEKTIESSASFVDHLVNSQIDIEPISLENETIETKSTISAIPIEALSEEIIQSKRPKFQQKNTETLDNQPQTNNVLADLVKSTSSGFLARNINATMGNGNQNSSGFGNGNNQAGAFGIKERLSVFGAKTGDVQLSIAWDTIDDIDIHVMIKNGNITDGINWTNRIGISGGVLDIDMNAQSQYLNRQPVENIFWPYGSSPNGIFVVYIHFFRSWSGATRVPVMIRVKNGEKIETFNAIAILGKNPEEIVRFTR